MLTIASIFKFDLICPVGSGSGWVRVRPITAALLPSHPHCGGGSMARFCSQRSGEAPDSPTPGTPTPDVLALRPTRTN